MSRSVVCLQSDEIQRERWGELEVVEEEEEDEEEEEEEEEQEPEDYVQPEMDATGLATPLADGISSVSSGLSTPGVVDLRKGIRYVFSACLLIASAGCSRSSSCSGMETPDAPPQQLYTVLAQKDISVGTSLYGSSHEYVVPGESSGMRSETGRVRRRFEDAGPTSDSVSGETSVAPEDDENAVANKKKKAKTEKSKSHKDFKF